MRHCGLDDARAARANGIEPIGLKSSVGSAAEPRWLPRLLLALCALWLCIGPLAVGALAAQTYDPTKFCYGNTSNPLVGCYDTRQDAETAMRGDPFFGGFGAFLQHIETTGALVGTTPANPTVAFYYRIKERAPVAKYTMYAADLGSAGGGGFGCAPAAGDPHPDYADWCADESALVAAAQQQLLTTSFGGCTLLSTTIVQDNSANASPWLEPDPNNPQRGLIRGNLGYDTQYRRYETTAQCPGNPFPDTKVWSLRRHTTFYCQNGFQSDIGSGRIDNAYCKANNSQVAYIAGPLQQCDSCAASANPIYPATGEKAR